MKEKVELLIEEVSNKLSSVTCMQDVIDLKGTYLSKKGPVNELSMHLKNLPAEEKKEFGMLLNSLKQKISAMIEEKIEFYKQEELNKRLESEKIDVTLPAVSIPIGSASILEYLIEEVEEVFMSMGYDVVDGPEIEEDKYNFELLNLPKGHPARDAQDTFYIEDDKKLLRSQTSPVQVRTMLEAKGTKPIRMICPGKTYRRDDDDATHSHQFTQIEGLLVDKNISLSDLKGTFDLIAKKLFKEDIKTRFRPSYYPFTEPSVETDISCFACKGKGCSICKNTGWITVSGAGMVSPIVLRNCGYDDKEWTGFAFGFGAERLAMLKYGIDDCRVLYNNDLREIKQFDRKKGA